MPSSRTRIRPRRDAKQILATVIWASLILVAAVLLSRRYAGGFSSQQGSVVAACLAGTAAMLLSLAAHLIYYAGRNSQKQPTAHFLTGVATLLPPSAIALTVFPFGSNAGIAYLAGLFLLAATALVLTAEHALWSTGIADRRTTRRHMLTSPDGTPATGSTEQPLTSPRHRVSSAPLPSSPEQASAQQPGQTETTAFDDQPPSQWMTRTTTPDGSERIAGSVHVHFAAGQRQAAIHLPFVPPLADVPQVDCQVLDDDSARLRVTDARPYGARIEVKRGQPVGEAGTIEVGFVAAAACRHRHAA